MKIQLEYSCLKLLMLFLVGVCASTFVERVNADMPMPGLGNDASSQGYSTTVLHSSFGSTEGFTRVVFTSESADSLLDSYISSSGEEEHITTIMNISIENSGVNEAVNTFPVAIALHDQAQAQAQASRTAINNHVNKESLSVVPKTVSSESQVLPASPVPNPELHVMLLVGLGLIILSLRSRTHINRR